VGERKQAAMRASPRGARGQDAITLKEGYVRYLALFAVFLCGCGSSNTALTFEEAQGLVSVAGQSLDLDQIKTLSGKASIALGQHKGGLSLKGLTHLTPEDAKSLAGVPNYLRLSGLAKLSQPVAIELARHRGGLYLDGVKTLEPDIAKVMESFQCTRIDLSGLSALSVDAAWSLAEYGCRGRDLNLSGITDLPAEVAEQLAAFGGRFLYLNGVKTLSDDAAKAMAAFKGEFLDLDGITSLSDEAAVSLAKFGGRAQLSLKGVVVLSPKARETLKTNAKIKLRD
jgi:hypothetical protein